jgi:hypothetical protein
MSQRIAIPSLEQVKKAIEEFRIEDWNIKDYTQVNGYVKKLDDYFDQKLGFRIRSVGIINTKNLSPNVYRIRPFDEKINVSLISEFSHPPVNLTNKIQRANLPYHPVFYCSPDPRTALIETLEYTYREGEEKLYYLSEWSLRKDQPALATPFIFGEYNAELGFYNTYRDKTFDYIKSKFENITSEETESLRQILIFFSKLFEYRDSHALSGYIGHMHLYAWAMPRTDIFIYPSIQSEKYKLNYAIHPNAVLYLLRLNRVYLLRVYKYKINRSSGFVTLRVGYHNVLGINNDLGHLVWGNLPDVARAHLKVIMPELSIQPE